MIGLILVAALADAKQWREDIAFVRQKIESTHPNPWRRTTKAAFEEKLASLSRDVPKLNDDQIAVRLMEAVATLRDKHTSLVPEPLSGFDTWFPMHLHEFSDGVFITAINKQSPQLVGAKVLRIGSRDINEALLLAKALYSSDNDFAAMNATTLLSSARLLRGLGVNDSLETLPLDLQLRDGMTSHVELHAVKSKSSFAWTEYGEMSAPPGTDLVTAFGGRSSDDYFDPDKNADLPLHLRARRGYWFTYLDKPRVAYMQLNAMADHSRYTPETFAAFLDRVFTFVDLHPVDKFILDVRYDVGGNGDLNNSVVHRFIKREESIGRPGHLFLIGGRKTYSAGSGLYLSMLNHTDAIAVGEPIGAGYNGSGDPDYATLPNTKFRLSCSTNYYIARHSKDESWFVPVSIPATFSSSDYFGGKDPAVDAILAGDANTILNVLREQGGEMAKERYARDTARYGSLSWWQPFGRDAMNQAVYETLLQSGRIADAMVGFEMNVDRYPDWWEAWDSLAEALMDAKQNERAIAAYEKALALNHDNFNAMAERAAIEKMKAAPPR